MTTKPPKNETRKNETCKARKVGGQPGNRNKLRHGLRAGQLPKDAKYIEVRINGLRRQIEDILLEQKKKITLTDAALVQTIIRWEKHACLAQRWLTKEYDELKPSDKLSFSREIAKASSERDKAIVLLKLDRGEKVVDLKTYLEKN